MDEKTPHDEEQENESRKEIDTSISQSETRNSRTRAWERIIIIALLLGTTLFVFQSLRNAPGDMLDKGTEIVGKVAEKSVQAVATLIKAVKSGTVITEFRNNSMKVKGIQKLQVAELQATENFSKRDFPAFLPEIEVDITVPVEYVYTVDFQGNWNIEADSSEQGVVLKVIAPRIMFNTPAPDISKMKKRIIKSSPLRNEKKLLSSLQDEVSLKLKVRALDNIPLIREIARRSVSNYFQEWFFKQYQAFEPEDIRITVQFQDEQKEIPLKKQPLQ